MLESNPLRQEIVHELEFLRSMGTKIFLYPFIGRKMLEMFGYIITYILVLCTAVQLALTLFSLSTKDWLEIINVAPNLGVVVMTVIKYTKIQIHKELYDEIFNHFRDDMWNIVGQNSPAHKHIIMKYKWITVMINRFLLYYSILLTIVVNSFPYLVMMYEKKANGVTDEYLYPFDGWYPFDKVKWYTGAYIWESCMTAVVVCVYGFSNMIHASYIIFICMELRILGNCLEEILSPENITELSEGRNVNLIHSTVTRKLKIIIAKHEFLAKRSAKLDAVLGDAMLLNFSLGAIFICLTAFTFMVVDNLYKSVRYFFMFASLLVEIFNQCFIGQVLSDHSENLTNAVYFSNWPNASPEAKKIMLMLMMRTQKPFELTGNGYFVMNMNTFSSICSTSYQFFNLLRTVYL
ncbi:putative odorant receptor 92a [Vanessa cardui]|uniref:putative odorant receptor 92a n=1 Tax=Vanessa cardui TaxID=171605 RepID=UPI001F138E72|nr:putative odorant receptor 92a [Vanessa cardui]